jgi:hypothetical protein
MRDLVVFCGLALATIGIASPQSTAPSTEFERGSIDGNTYANPVLGITWELPKDWEIQNKGVSLLGDDHYVFLRVLPGSTQSQYSDPIPMERWGLLIGQESQVTPS